jgi:hypothetical protein
MSGASPTPSPDRDEAAASRRAAQRSTRWPLLAVLVVLLAMLGGVIVLEGAAPSPTTTLPPLTGLPVPVLDEPVACTRADERDAIEQLRASLDPAGRITSEMVYACPRLFDGLEVIHVGEVVGDVLARRGGAWALVNDDAYALEVGPLGASRAQRGFNSGLSVWLPDGLHEQLGAPGRFGRRGDIVRLEGVLLRADPADGGGITLRATALEVLAPSVAVDEPLNRALAVAAGVVMTLALLAMLIARRRRRDA